MRNERALETPPDSVSITVDGGTFEGHFRSGRGFVMLTSEFGSCVAQRGRLTAHAVAEILLRKLVLDRRAERRPNQEGADREGAGP